MLTFVNVTLVYVENDKRDNGQECNEQKIGCERTHLFNFCRRCSETKQVLVVVVVVVSSARFEQQDDVY